MSRLKITSSTEADATPVSGARLDGLDPQQTDERRVLHVFDRRDIGAAANFTQRLLSGRDPPIQRAERACQRQCSCVAF